jgi:triphosphoribosyl-dephospho-CoA synthase
MIEAGEEYLPFLHTINREYIRMNLTMGGMADMLGLSYAYLIASGALSMESLIDLRTLKPRPVRCIHGSATLPIRLYCLN